MRHFSTALVALAATLLLPPAAPADAAFRGNLFGAVGAFDTMTTYDQAYLARIDANTGVLSPLASGYDFINGVDYEIQGGTVRDGIYYTVATPADADTGFTVVWNRFDLASRRWLEPISFGYHPEAMAYSMTYNASNDRFYVLGLDPGASEFSYLSIIDAKTWEITPVGRFNDGGFLAGIAYCPVDGFVYILGQNNYLYRFDEEDGDISNVGQATRDYALVSENRATAFTYSPLDHAFVAVYIDNENERFNLAFIDSDTYDTVLTPALSPERPYLLSLFSTDPYSEDGAPAYPDTPAVDFEKNALSGTITLTAPSETYGGEPLPGNVDALLAIDGKTVFSGSMAPASTKAVDVTVAEGMHEGVFTCSSGSLTSAPRKFSFYVGDDTPMAPAGIAILGNELSWTNPGATGVNGGYVDAQAITYDVTLDGVRLNSGPVTECRYTIPADGSQKRREIAVTASAAGKTSAPASLTAVLGDALGLPFSMTPTPEEATLFTPFDANGDGSTFFLGQDEMTMEPLFCIYTVNGDADDWLFLPALGLADRDHLYSLAFRLRSVTPYESRENLEVVVASVPDPSGVVASIMRLDGAGMSEETLRNVRFAVPQGGSWYIGFHCTSKAGVGAGVRMRDFTVEALDDSSAVPAAPADVKVTAAPLGALRATLDITMPSVDMKGDALAASGQISVAVDAGAGAATANALPGAVASVDVDVPASGFATFAITPSNAEGDGNAFTTTAYVGIDVPLAPQNIKGVTSADNLSMEITWDAPGEVGVNGGYVDIDDVRYRMYSVQGITLNELATTDQLSYTFTPLTTGQQRWSAGPAAFNGSGESQGSSFPVDILGTPFPLPARETFNQFGLAYNPLTYSQDGVYANSSWELVGSIASLVEFIEEDCEDGALIVYNTGRTPAMGELVLPKFDARTVADYTFTLRWLDWEYTPAFSLWARCYGSEEPELIAEIEPSRPGTGEWVESEIAIPAKFAGVPWVQFRVRAALSTEDKEYGFIDSYVIGGNVSTDMQLASLTGETDVKVGEEWTYTATAVNAGQVETEATLEFSLTGADGESLLTASEELPSLVWGDRESVDFSVTMLREYLDNAPLTLTARVVAPGDGNAANDSMSLTIGVAPSQVPVVGDLRASRNGETAVLEWSEPDLQYGGDDSFEYLKPFEITENLGMWLNIDQDGQVPFAINGSNRWPGDDQPCAWTVINAEELGANASMPRFMPHKGKQYIMARNASFDESDPDAEPVQSSDWLISPEIVGGTDINFWYGTGDGQYTEYVELWTSSTTRDIDAFTKVRSFSKSGDEVWEPVSFPLPDDARYFALVYRSIDSFCAMLDDISFTPVRLEQWELLHYNVVRTLDDGTVEVFENVGADGGYTDATLGRSGAVYNVVTVVTDGHNTIEGPRSNTAALERTGVDDITMLTGVTGRKGFIDFTGLQGVKVAVYNAAGMYVRSLTPDADRFSIPAGPGVYVVKAGNRGMKVIVR